MSTEASNTQMDGNTVRPSWAGDDSPWQRLGFEIELLAPSGRSRADLAHYLADANDGTVERIFRFGSEPSLVPGKPIFHHLSLAQRVRDASGREICILEDDITIVDDLDGNAPATDDWYRIICDDRRLLRILESTIDPELAANDAMELCAKAFDLRLTNLAGGRVRLDDADGATVAIALPQGGERERVTEIVLPPRQSDLEQSLEQVLGPARELGFTVPSEAAVHVHLDAQQFRNSDALARLIRLFGQHRERLWAELQTNTKCRRVGPLPEGLVNDANSGWLALQDWTELEDRLRGEQLSRYSDVNLVNMLDPSQGPDTVEIRILPGSLDAASILNRVALLQERWWLGW